MTKLSEETLIKMKYNAQRMRAKESKGSMAEPRTFVKPGVYTGTELKRRWRSTIWDDVPSLMASQRIPHRA